MIERGARASITDFEALTSDVGPIDAPSTFGGDDEPRAREPKARLRALCAAAAKEPGSRGATPAPVLVDGFQALVSGRYALADHFDDGETRLLVAVRLDDEESNEGGLSIRETQVAAYVASGLPLKVAAYELGISVASAGRASFAAIKKLGLHGRTELATRLQPFLGPLR